MEQLKPLAKILGVITTAGMFLVLVMGATVTNTGSATGCGQSWPLCRGKLIPQMAVSTAIEFSHRAVVGVETVLILALAAVALVLYRRRLEMQILAPLMVLFLFLQAGLGAWAVMAPQASAVLALHFGVSLVSFASVLLTAVFLFEADGQESLRDHPLPRHFVWFGWIVAAYSYVVVYLGAYVRHVEADRACQGWPLCNGQVVPTLRGPILYNFVHRGAAGLLALAIAALCIWAWHLRGERPDIFRGAIIALALVVLQSLSGALIVWTHADLFSALLHAGLVGLMFAGLTYICMHLLPRPSTVTETAPEVLRPRIAPGIQSPHA